MVPRRCRAPPLWWRGSWSRWWRRAQWWRWQGAVWPGWPAAWWATSPACPGRHVLGAPWAWVNTAPGYWLAWTLLGMNDIQNLWINSLELEGLQILFSQKLISFGAVYIQWKIKDPFGSFWIILTTNGVFLILNDFNCSIRWRDHHHGCHYDYQECNHSP